MSRAVEENGKLNSSCIGRSRVSKKGDERLTNASARADSASRDCFSICSVMVGRTLLCRGGTRAPETREGGVAP